MLKIMSSREFYERDTAEVAEELLGKVLTHKSGEGAASGMVVETEAYYGDGDPASRASTKKTKINEIMWERPGLALVYMVHGNWLFNVTTEAEGTPGAVLIRALEPLEGLDLMRKRRKKDDSIDLASGPGKLTQALGITKEHHGSDVTVAEGVYISEPRVESKRFEVETSHRIGVTEDLERELRFFAAENDHVST